MSGVTWQLHDFPRVSDVSRRVTFHVTVRCRLKANEGSFSPPSTWAVVDKPAQYSLCNKHCTIRGVDINPSALSHDVNPAANSNKLCYPSNNSQPIIRTDLS